MAFRPPGGCDRYVCLDDIRRPISRSAIYYTAAAVTVSALIVTIVIAGWSHVLPALFVDRIGFTPLANYVTGVDFALAVLASLAILSRSTKSLISGWATVAIVAMVAELALVTFVISGRFSFGFYLCRSLSVIVSIVVLIALLGQIVGQDARLAYMNIALQFERTRRPLTVDAALSAVAHEINQPLTAIAMNAHAARLFFRNGSEPNAEKLMDSLNDIDTDVFRANQIVGSIRDLFRPEPDHDGPLNINDIVLQVLRIFRDRIHHHSVTLDVRLDLAMPPVVGHKTQLQKRSFSI